MKWDCKSVIVNEIPFWAAQFTSQVTLMIYIGPLAQSSLLVLSIFLPVFPIFHIDLSTCFSSFSLAYLSRHLVVHLEKEFAQLFTDQVITSVDTSTSLFNSLSIPLSTLSLSKFYTRFASFLHLLSLLQGCLVGQQL